ncbi:hypothetical protein GC173_10105 [bacterium]|nr:hypothetical protein [bacterium]
MKKGLFLSALVMLTIHGGAEAQQLANPGTSPSNPLAILSVPDTRAIERGLDASTFGNALAARFGTGWQGAELAEVRRSLSTVSESLGIDMQPGAFLTDQVQAFDLYVVEVDGVENYLISARMREPGVGTRIVDRIREEATGASGVSGGFRADTVVERAVPKGRTVYLPAFEIYFANLESGALLYSTNQKVLESALADDGRAMFTSAYFERFGKGLGETEGQPWMLGEVRRLAPLLASVTGISPLALDMALPESAGIRLSMGPDRVELVAFTPQEEIKGDARRYALAAPPPALVSTAQGIPSKALVSFATEHFDGIWFLDSVLGAVDRLPGRTGTAQSVSTALDKSRSDLGFDPRTDFMAALGPGLAIFVSELKPAADPLSPPEKVEATLVAGVRDMTRFTRVVKLLEERLSPPPPAPKGSETPAPPKNPIRTEEFDGVRIRSVAEPPVAWALTDTRFIVGTSPSAVKDALEVISNPSTSLTETADFKAAAAAQDPTQTSVLAFSGRQLADLFTTLPPEWATVVRSAEFVSVATAYRPEGAKTQVTILTSPAK